MVQPVRLAAPPITRPPPSLAELPLMVHSVSVAVPSSPQPAAVVFRRVAGDGTVGERRRALVIQAAAVEIGRAAGDGQGRRWQPSRRYRPETLGSCPPPLTVTPAAGPVIVSVPPVSVSSSWPCASVIVCAARRRSVEGDRLGTVQQIRQADSLAQAQVARGRAGAVARGIDHEPGLNLEGPDVGG